MVKIHFIFIYFLLFSTLIAQNEEETILARVGNITVTQNEFKQRYELMPQIGRENLEIKDDLKRNLIYSIVAEKLWALYAEETGLDTSDIMKYTYKAIEKMYLRDALYKIEVQNKAKVPEEEYIKAVLKNNVILDIYYLKSDSETEINTLYS